jgi:hypothetical protein
MIFGITVSFLAIVGLLLWLGLPRVLRSPGESINWD